MLVVLGDVIQQEFLELVFRSVHALRQALFAQDAEKAFDHGNPEGMGGGVVEVHLGISSPPALGRFVFVDKLDARKGANSGKADCRVPLLISARFHR